MHFKTRVELDAAPLPRRPAPNLKTDMWLQTNLFRQPSVSICKKATSRFTALAMRKIVNLLHPPLLAAVLCYTLLTPISCFALGSLAVAAPEDLRSGQKMTLAASAFVTLLTNELCMEVVFPSASDADRTRWSNAYVDLRWLPRLQKISRVHKPH